MSHFEAHGWVPRAAGRRRRGGVGAADISHPCRDPRAPPQELRVLGTEQPTEQASPPPPQHSQQESLQKLKRSLSFKTKSLRSKSADNFFQRTNSDVKLQADVLAEVSPSSSPLPAPGSLTSTPTRASLYPSGGGKAHAFQEHIFKKPTFCDVCNHMIPKGFRRYYSSPLLIHEQFGCIKEVMPIACGNKVDPVYETLRFGTSLAQRTKKSSSGSGSDSPHRTSTSDLVEVPEEADGPGDGYDLRKRSNSVFTYPENGTDDFRDQAKSINHQGPLSKDPLQMNTYVALYKFVPQENEDLEMSKYFFFFKKNHLVTVITMNVTIMAACLFFSFQGKIQDRIGFFPANFVQRVHQNEKIFRCVRTFTGCKEQGQITLKENQICVASEEEQDGFIRVLSGKKRGLVPLDVLENI
ncbi:hypothetical protein FD755_010253 [Muntiacus reevesi]|uniref:SH3 domain-containing protein n=1 Tax=Muntiacus reevesi TaxID=9886 RepID=A0A5N3XZ31_MUNRE|nr:hypothetical protein FD755_010253 [Muntiacus reevesi]